jgi:hypothetical protein
VTRKPLSVLSVLLRGEAAKDAEPLVPRHENAALRRQPARSATSPRTGSGSPPRPGRQTVRAAGKSSRSLPARSPSAPTGTRPHPPRREILHASANLTDYQKILAENFNDKFRALPPAFRHIAAANKYDLDRFVFLDALSNVAPFDAGIATWHYKLKLRYDAVRPFTAIRYLYGATGTSSPGAAPVRAPSPTSRATSGAATSRPRTTPEYPSTSTAFCGALAQAARRFTGRTPSACRSASPVLLGKSSLLFKRLVWTR